MTEASPEQTWATALQFLREAERSPAADTPRMAVHAAYYAAFHAARVVLLKLEGDEASNKHSGVRSRFGYHARLSGDPKIVAAGRILVMLQQERLLTDYNINADLKSLDGAAAIREARVFLQSCATWQSFTPP